jgi:hypothetical protein
MGWSIWLFDNFNQQPGSPALYPLRMSVGMKGEQIGDYSRAT